MRTRFVSVDRETPLLLPPDLREWVPPDDLVHFVLEAVREIPLSDFQVNVRGTGSAQYPPSMMLALLIYCYANGLFSSRRIERATYRDIAVRYLTGDTHPDHDTISKFRRENASAIRACFVRMLEMAQELGLLKVGTVSIDGSKIAANASRDRSVRYDHAGALIERLEGEVESLLKQAENADLQDADDGQRIPEAIAEKKTLQEKLREARARIEERDRQRIQAEEAIYERERERNQQRQAKGDFEKPSRAPRKPKRTFRKEAQCNLTDGDSGLMRRDHTSGYLQGYNAQVAVDADGTQLILGARVAECAFDYRELVPDVAAIPASLGKPSVVLADGGYASEDQARQIEASGIEVYISARSQRKDRRKNDLRPQSLPIRPDNSKTRNPYWESMHEKLGTTAGRAQYKLRQQSVEPVFGIIKCAMGFTRFHLRGIQKVTTEWEIVATAYNLRRLHKLITVH